MLSLLLIPLLASTAFAHGIVSNVIIDGKSFKGNLPNGRTAKSIIRQVSSQDPNHGATTAAINCGPNAAAGSLVADANPGSVVEFDWTGADGTTKWPHNIGPMLTYMASCGGTTCDKFDSKQAKWFKIDQVGKSSNGKWAQEALMSGQTAKVTLPPTLAPGNYLIRHEIIALHLATKKGGAEFYPSCAQLRVGGSQSGKPASSELVSLPGAYSDNDPGIFAPNVFDSGNKYVFPGPKVAAFVSGAPSAGGSEDGTTTSKATSTGKASTVASSSATAKATPSTINNGSSGSSNSGAGSSSTAKATPSSSTTVKATPSAINNASGNSSSGSGKCKSKKNSSSVAAPSGTPAVDENVAQYRPRHLSRVMRNVALGSL